MTSASELQPNPTNIADGPRHFQIELQPFWPLFFSRIGLWQSCNVLISCPSSGTLLDHTLTDFSLTTLTDRLSSILISGAGRRSRQQNQQIASLQPSCRLFLRHWRGLCAQRQSNYIPWHPPPRPFTSTVRAVSLLSVIPCGRAKF